MTESAHTAAVSVYHNFELLDKDEQCMVYTGHIHDPSPKSEMYATCVQ
jgi:hypothetical protein